MEKDKVIEVVKEWIEIDNNIKTAMKDIRNKREEKKILTNILVDVMRNNDIDCFDVNDSSIVYSKRRVKSGITKKHLLASLSSMFEGDDEKAKQVVDQILETRQEKESEVIKRLLNKK